MGAVAEGEGAGDRGGELEVEAEAGGVAGDGGAALALAAEVMEVLTPRFVGGEGADVDRFDAVDQAAEAAQLVGGAVAELAAALLWTKRGDKGGEGSPVSGGAQLRVRALLVVAAAEGHDGGVGRVAGEAVELAQAVQGVQA